MRIITTATGYWKPGLLGRIVGGAERLAFLGQHAPRTLLPEFTVELDRGERRDFCQFGRDFVFTTDPPATRTLHPLDPEVSRIPGWLFNHIARSTPAPGRTSPYRFTSSYQGQTDYELLGCAGVRFSFRWAMCPWQWSYEERPVWNWPDRESFMREFNGAWGLLLRGSEPVNAEQLRLFREFHCPTAVTGYHDHATNQWVECEPTDAQPGHASWLAHRKD